MKILNIGSLNIDRTYSVERFVQPKETIRSLRYEEFCGGKGLNQSVALAKAGAEVYHAGSVGKDGAMLVEMLQDAGANTEYLQILAEPSGHAMIQVDKDGQNNIIVVAGTNDRNSREYIQRVLDEFHVGDFVLLQNEIPNTDFAMEYAKKRGMNIAFNPSPINESIWKNDLRLVDYFILNEVEGKALAEIESEKVEDIRKGLLEKYPDATFVLTLGEKGAVLFNVEEELRQESFSVQAVDTTGAGDTFCGYFLSGLMHERTPKQCLKEASAAAAISVGQKGAATSIPRYKDVVEFLEK